MCNCGKNSCNVCGQTSLNTISGINNQIVNLTELVNTLVNQTKWLSGHPILFLEDTEDIALFDLNTGEGFGKWVGWGVCNGTSYISPKGFISTPDLRNRFIVGSQGAYVVGDTGGEDFHQLLTAEMPIHNHTLTDPGHTHTITDTGHTHTVNDPGHTHIATVNPHQHSFTTDSNGAHQHDVESYDARIENNDGLGDRTDVARPGGSRTTTSNGNHTHTGTTDPTGVVVTNSTTATGVAVNSGVTGNVNQNASTGITLGNTGGGEFHENRPPYYACLFVKKIF